MDVVCFAKISRRDAAVTRIHSPFASNLHDRVHAGKIRAPKTRRAAAARSFIVPEYVPDLGAVFIAVCTLLETRCTYLVKGESTLHRPTMIHSCIAIPSIRGRTRGELRRLGTALSPLDTKRKEIAIATKLPLGAWPLRSARASSSLHPPRGFCFAYAAPFFRGPSGYYTTGLGGSELTESFGGL